VEEKKNQTGCREDPIDGSGTKRKKEGGKNPTHPPDKDRLGGTKEKEKKKGKKKKPEGEEKRR